MQLKLEGLVPTGEVLQLIEADFQEDTQHQSTVIPEIFVGAFFFLGGCLLLEFMLDHYLGGRKHMSFCSVL